MKPKKPTPKLAQVIPIHELRNYGRPARARDHMLAFSGRFAQAQQEADPGLDAIRNELRAMMRSEGRYAGSPLANMMLLHLTPAFLAADAALEDTVHKSWAAKRGTD